MIDSILLEYRLREQLIQLSKKRKSKKVKEEIELIELKLVTVIPTIRRLEDKIFELRYLRL